MSGQGKSEIAHQDEPLFVLKFNDPLKEIRLYNDRIVEVSKWAEWTEKKEVKLVNAKFWVTNYRCDFTLFGSGNVIAIWDQDTKGLFPRSKGVFWSESWVNLEDSKRLLDLLAYLSGRKFSDFQRPMLSAEKLIKTGTGPRDIGGYTFNEEVLSEDPGEKAFDRIANIGLLVIAIFLMLGMCILYYPLLRDLF